MAFVEELKRHVAKWSLQRSLNNQILDYKAILDLCEDEMMSIKFFGICKESMILKSWVLKILRNLGTLYLSHGVVTI